MIKNNELVNIANHEQMPILSGKVYFLPLLNFLNRNIFKTILNEKIYLHIYKIKQTIDATKTQQYTDIHTKLITHLILALRINIYN